MKKIAVIGPESTGKSTLCMGLSEHYQVDHIKEYSREFLVNLERDYDFEDLLTIAEGQFNSIINYDRGDKTFLISDTEVITVKIWSDVKYGKSDQKLLDLIDKQDFDLYLLCDTDLEWEKDPLREVPDLQTRKRIFSLFQQELESRLYNFKIVKGQGIERNNLAINFIDELFE